ncbi:MAG: helix-turn-helix transcriptional regulator [Ktedonobacterales bacterium]|nr:helix-turn-helix transcriptional regulator [Ktedonobacterales bacterium]
MALDLNILVLVTEKLLGQEKGIHIQINAAVAEVSQGHARLVYEDVEPRRRAPTSEFPVPARFGARDFALLLIASCADSPGTPALPPDSMYQLARMCGALHFLLEQAALIESLIMLRGLTTKIPERLTPREAQVLRLMFSGHGKAAMSEQLRITPSTLKKHLEHIYSKLDVHCTLDAVLKAYQAGLVSYITS